MPISKETLRRLVSQFNSTRQLVVGDMVIDEMVYGSVDRLSREAPVIILRHRNTDVVLGGGANAVHNVAAFGAQVHALGVWGDDYFAPQLKAAMENAGIDTSTMVTDATRPTTTKTRISGVISSSLTQQMVRIDRESRAPLAPHIHTCLMTSLEKQLPLSNGVLLSDYGLGVITPELAEHALKLAIQLNVPIAVDSQQDLATFQNATIMTPNQPEAEKNVGFALDSRDAILKAGQVLLNKANAKYSLITLGQDGMALFERESQQAHFIPVFNKSDVFDVTGAGDTVVATWLVAYASGASALEAAVLGNLAASIVVKTFGSAVTSQAELTEAIHTLPDTLLDSIESVSLNAKAPA